MIKIKRFTFNFNFDIDLKFWALIPAFNLNFHSNTFEFEFLCFSIYIDVVEVHPSGFNKARDIHFDL